MACQPVGLAQAMAAQNADRGVRYAQPFSLGGSDAQLTPLIWFKLMELLLTVLHRAPTRYDQAFGQAVRLLMGRNERSYG